MANNEKYHPFHLLIPSDLWIKFLKRCNSKHSTPTARIVHLIVQDIEEHEKEIYEKTKK